MSRLSAEEIAQHAYRAGFRGQALTTAVAVALAESGGNARAHNGTPPDNSYGLWQVNMLGSLGPARRHEFHLNSNDELFNADENAKAAWSISGHGKSFQPWSTYTDGAYKSHLAAARKAAEDVTRHHGAHPPKPAPHKPAPHKPAPHKGGPDGGFKADLQQFVAYEKKTEQIADELVAVGRKTVHRVAGIAKDSFGKVGQETGFSDALGEFSRSLESQVRATGAQARTLSASVFQARQAYAAADADAKAAISAQDIKGILG
ncbi:transglycosylase SLT domain-containing protein [Amycolatopsis benzoatilytica]|uniref:transglycosylase SLT domain-containing protein n=1 Tax=Amycolatopsis benzoatilytica TaxID=346045 RepID=UPI00036A57FF|nr:transglycosylase SLT domain-containing protein [Amycolatopsis benzoatilytica]